MASTFFMWTLPLVLFFIDISICINLSRREIFDDGAASSRGPKPQLQWGVNATHIEVQLAYPTRGWVALGLSPNGGMDFTDVLFGFVNDTSREVVIQDRFINAKGRVNVSVDNQQDWIPISGSQNATHTIIRAVRRLSTCDPADRSITNTSVPVLFSYGNNDPSTKTGPIQKHSKRGTSFINLLYDDSNDEPSSSDPITLTWNLTMQSIPVPGDKAYPIIDRRNTEMIHHILVYSCSSEPKNVVKDQFFECGFNSKSDAMTTCQGMIGGWAVGEKGGEYPTDTGLPFTPEMSGKYVMLEVHYNNAKMAPAIDNSGFTFHLTNKLRKYDLGNFEFGVLNFNYLMTIPHKQKSFEIRAQCSDQCTSTIPPDGIKIVSASFHMHMKGVTGVARHYRGNKELAPLLDTDRWNFNHPLGVEYVEPRVFLPGDRIVVECQFDTSGDDAPTYGGEATDEEMCLVFFEYYPKVDLSTCGSYFKLEDYLKAIEAPASLISSVEFEPTGDSEDDTDAEESLYRDSVEKYLKTKNWTPENVAKLEQFYKSNGYYGYCGFSSGNELLITDDIPPPITPYDRNPRGKCGPVSAA